MKEDNGKSRRKQQEEADGGFFPSSFIPHPSSFGKLAAGEVHVWSWALGRPAGEVARLLELLADDERERAGRYLHVPAREQFVAARAGLRLILAGYLALDSARIAFTHGPAGKPALAHWPGLHFNVSHSADVALIAVTRRGEVGVDVERVRPFANDLGMAERFFSPYETGVLRSLEGERRRAAFFHAWTRKEAYLKARGQGLSYGLERVEVTLLPEEAARFLRIDGCERLAAQWSLHHLVPAVGCVGALTLHGHDYELRCWRWNGAAETP